MNARIWLAVAVIWSLETPLSILYLHVCTVKCVNLDGLLCVRRYRRFTNDIYRLNDIIPLTLRIDCELKSTHLLCNIALCGCSKVGDGIIMIAPRL